MFERFHSKTMTATAAALLSALGVGGIAVAQSTQNAAKAPAKASQSTEAPGTEAPDSGTETPEAPGSEAPGNDGPGGHADEPGNPNAQHEATGAE
jgi:hypothetical protein